MARLPGEVGRLRPPARTWGRAAGDPAVMLALARASGKFPGEGLPAFFQTLVYGGLWLRGGSCPAGLGSASVSHWKR